MLYNKYKTENIDVLKPVTYSSMEILAVKVEIKTINIFVTLIVFVHCISSL